MCACLPWVPEGGGAPGAAVMMKGTFLSWDVSTAELVVNKWALYTAFVAVPGWTIPSNLETVVVWAEVSSLPAGLRVRCSTPFQGPSVRWGDAELPAWLGRAAKVRSGGKALLWSAELKIHNKSTIDRFVYKIVPKWVPLQFPRGEWEIFKWLKTPLHSS